MAGAQARLNIATGNLANVSTDGFERVLARGRLTASGVEVTSAASSERGAFRRTGRPYDLALIGKGAFRVRADDGTTSETRDGAFERDRFGMLRDARGRALLGNDGLVHVPDGATIDERGRVVVHGAAVDRIQSGRDGTIRSGFIETSSVNAVDEMVCVLTSQRSFESAEKVVASIDSVRQKSSNDVARIK